MKFVEEFFLDPDSKGEWSVSIASCQIFVPSPPLFVASLARDGSGGEERTYFST